ncbi:MAG: GNAT family N-acetyltransferase [Candidatus Hodarchaeota archaeon]
MKNPFVEKEIIFRAIEPGDVPKLWEWFSNPIVRGYGYVSDIIPLWIPFSRYQMDQVFEEWKKDSTKRFIIEHREDKASIGFASFSDEWDPHCPSFDVFICLPYRRHSFGQKAVTMLLDYLFNYTLAHVVTTWLAEYAEAGLRFLQSLGFEEYGRMRRAGRRDGIWYDIVVLGILRREWQKEPEV